MQQYDIYTRRHQIWTGYGIPFLLGLMAVANVVHAGMIFNLAWPDAMRASYVVQGLVSAIYAVIAVSRGHIWRALAALIILLLLVGAHTVFVLNSGSDANYNAAITHVPLLSFIALIESNYPIEKVLRVLLVASIGYLLVYITFYTTIVYYATNNPDYAEVVRPTHDGTSARVYLAAAYAAFVAMYGLRSTNLMLPARIGLILLAAVALWLSDSRSIIICIALTFGLSAAGLLIRPVRFGLLAAVLGVAVLMLIGVAVPGWNPFNFSTHDNSTVYRAMEYEHVVRIVQAKWVTGVGTPGDFESFQHYLQVQFGVSRYDPLFPSDLGVLGPHFEFGLLGVIAFVLLLSFCMTAELYSPRPELQALRLTCFACALQGAISPMLLVEPSAFFAVLLFSAWYRERRPEPLSMPTGEWRARR